MNLHPTNQIVSAAIEEARRVAHYREVSMFIANVVARQSQSTSITGDQIQPDIQFIAADLTTDFSLSLGGTAQRDRNRIAAILGAKIGYIFGRDVEGVSMHDFPTEDTDILSMKRSLLEGEATVSSSLVRDVDVRIEEGSARNIRLAFGFSFPEGDPMGIDFVRSAIDDTIKRLQIEGKLY